MLDTDLKIQFINRVEPGLNKNDVIGTALYEYVEEDDRDRVRTIHQQVLDNNEARRYETRYRRNDGTIVYFESSASGVYTILTDNPTGDDKWNDPSMGAYYACYGTADAGSLPGGDLLVNELCNTISISGASQWGEIWSFDKVEVNGNELTLTITNDYGEGGITVLTNPNGWPALTN